MIDFTREITLEPDWKKKYFYSRIFVYLVFLAGVFYIAYLLLFPTASFVFSFQNPNSDKNTLLDPRNSQGETLQNGKVSADGKILFNANLDGVFSKASIQFALKNNSSEPISGTVSIRKSFRSFFYPMGEPMGFPDGSLVENNNSFYIISQGKLRKFANQSIISDLGFNPEAFLAATSLELSYDDKGDDIDSDIYPDDSIFKIQDNYYQLENQQLLEFTSEQAYLTRYNENQAIGKDSDFLNNYPVSADKIGFADGSLVSFGTGVFVVSGNKIFPVDNPRTFELMGFSWDDVLPANEDELATYKRDKLFTINDPHPNGTIFQGKEDKKYYMVEDGKKREIIGPDIIKTYLKRKPVLADEAGLTTVSSCQIKKNLVFSIYSCDIDLKPFQNLSGNDFEFTSNFNQAIEFNNATAVLKKSVNYENFRLSLSDIKNKILANYEGQ